MEKHLLSWEINNMSDIKSTIAKEGDCLGCHTEYHKWRLGLAHAPGCKKETLKRLRNKK